MAVYTFVDGTRKRVFSNKPCVFINGVKHTIGKCYTFINGTRKQIFDTWSLKNEELFLSDGSITLPFGTYEFVLRGAGGAGGETGQAKGTNNGPGGAGGAGSKGELVVSSVQLNSSTILDYVAGVGGKTHADGGNGGIGGCGGSEKKTQKGGSGGGGGYPTYIKNLNTVLSSALGGGGGGGGGGGAQVPNSRFEYGAGGGAGGGFYKTSNVSEKLTNSAISFYLADGGGSLSITGSEEQWLRINIPCGESLYVGQVFYGIFLSDQATVKVNSISGNDVVFGGTVIFAGSTINLNPITVNNLLTQYTGFHAVSVSGKNGADRGNYSANGNNGVDGNTIDFPNITSGHGGTGGDWGGERRAGGNGATGGGASGGGGGSNGKNADGSFGGPGGGGAGGSEDAGGGACGTGRSGYAVGATDGSNHHTIPTDTLSENAQYGVNSDWGIGGATNENGSQGFVLIKRVA